MAVRAGKSLKVERDGASRPLAIGALSRATSIPVETLRTWERRYGSPTPVRKPSGHRVYPAEAVAHLRRVTRLLARGHRPAEILGLSDRELDALLTISEPARAAAAPAPVAGAADLSSGHRVERLLEAVAGFDRQGMVGELQSGWASLGPVRFLEEVAGAFLVELGRAWREDRIEIRHEHFASSCLADFLRTAREPFEREARGPLAVAATLPGERHEGGLLIVTTLMALRGWRTLYLGADTPTEQVAGAVASSAAEAVALSVSAAMSAASASRHLQELRRAVPRRVAIWVGGAGAPEGVRGVERIGSIAALDARLREAGSR